MDDAPAPEHSSLLEGLDPGELLARGLSTVRMTGGRSADWTPPTPAELAALFPLYEIVSMLGRGGMGAVYRARQVSLDRIVAIKLLPLEISVDPSFAERFRREARAMAKLNHPNIVAVYDSGTTSDGHLYFVMEFVEGANLHQCIHHTGLEPEQSLTLASQVCAALSYAHGKGVIHRDIKPANVMIDLGGHAKVADFGLARLIDADAATGGSTLTGVIMGTPDYMAPEQKRGARVDHRADIYALGVMLYEMLCREVPQGVFAPPSRRIGCDTGIDKIVIKAMQQEPDQRYQSTQEMKADMDTARTLAPASSAKAPPVTPIPPPSPALPEPVALLSPAPRPGPERRATLYLGIAAALIVVIATFFLLTRKRAKDAPAPSDQGAPPVAGQEQSLASSPPVAHWVKLYPAREDLPEPWRARLTAPVWDGWISPGGGALNKANLGRCYNGGLRARFRQSTSDLYGQLKVRQGESESYALRVEQGQYLSLIISRFTPQGPGTPGKIDEFPLQKLRLLRPLQPGEEYTLELVAVGDQIMGRFNGAVSVTAADGRNKQQWLGIWSMIETRDLEVLNLDGLAEANALRWVKEGKYGGPNPSASVPTVANQEPPLVNSPEKGHWTRIFTKKEDLPEEWRDKVPSGAWDGWISPGDEALPYENLNRALNGGLRAHFRQGAIAEPGQLTIRSGGSDSFYLHVDNAEYLTIGYTSSTPARPGFRSKNEQYSIQKLKLPRPLQFNEEYALEFVAVGDHLIGRFNNTIEIAVTDTRCKHKMMFIWSKVNVRNIEILNLEGMSEADALKVAGEAIPPHPAP